MTTIGIIGWGIVGQSVCKGFGAKKNFKVLWYDKYKKGPFTLDEVVNLSEFIFVCVPTPMFADQSGIDLTIIEEVAKFVAPKIANTKKVFIIKSTVIPGSTTRLAKKYPKTHFAMNPEFLTEKTADEDFLHPDRTVIGATSPQIGQRLKKLYQEFYGVKHNIFVTNTTTAEMVKYASNAFLATKVIFANELYDICKKLKINYTEVKDMVGAEPRIGASHLTVTKERGFGGKCFPKDIVALLGMAEDMGVDTSLLSAVWKKNLALRKVRDWENIEGAVSSKKHTKK